MKDIFLNKKFELLAKFWKTERVFARKTQWELARELGYTSPQYISNIERGQCAYPLEAIPKLCKLFSLDINMVIERYSQIEKNVMKSVILEKSSSEFSHMTVE